MPVPPRRVAIDARMIAHSGIGVSLAAVLREWLREPPPFALDLLGAERALSDFVDEHLRGGMPRPRVHRWEAPIYSPAATLARPARMVPDASLFFSPHYATALFPGLPLVCMIHDLIHLSHPSRGGTGAFLRVHLAALRKNARAVIVPSRLVKVQLQTLHRFPAHRVLHVPPGPGIATPGAPEAPVPELADGAPYFLALGLFKRHKNWEVLLRALADLWRGGALQTRLAAGGHGRAREAFRALLRELKIEDRVTVLPHLSEPQVRSALRGARALLFPSLAEGFGLPVLEAMALGTPVLIAERFPMLETAAGAAMTFDPDRAGSLPEAILRLDRDDALRSRLAEEGQRRAGDFDWKSTADRFAAIFEETLGAAPSAEQLAE